MLGALISGEIKSFHVEANERFDYIEEESATYDVKIGILDKTKSNKRKVK